MSFYFFTSGTAPDTSNPALAEIAWAFTLTSGNYLFGPSTQRLWVRAVASERDGTALVASDYPLQIAFYKDPRVDLTDLEWHDLTFDDVRDAYLLVGPGTGAVTLAAGTYFVAVRTADAPRFAARAGVLRVLEPV